MDTKNLDSETLPVGEEQTGTEQPISGETEVDTSCEEAVNEEVSEKEVVEETVEEVVEENVEEVDEEAVEEIDEEIDEENAETQPIVVLSIEETVQKLRDLLESSSPQRKELNDCKAFFYNLLRNETEKQKQAFLANGGEEVDFVIDEPELYAEGKNLIAKINEKRAKIAVVEEAEKEANVLKKLSIIDQVKTLTEKQSQENFNKAYQEFKALQQQWNEIKLVPQAKINELWKQYQYYVEKFYDLVRINNEFREYDFKKNLELKIDLCEKAERLIEETDVVSAFHQLQNLHQEWREVGPVSRTEREEIWNRFKNTSTAINKKYQAHFEGLKGKEAENLILKTALCEKLEAIDCSQIKTQKGWNNKAKEVQEIQNQWRTIGYAPKKSNNEIYRRYRKACDAFFKAKSKFNKALNSEKEENLKLKIALCERAEALKESQDWKKTSQEMVELQKEWKKIGTVPNKHIDSVWKRFIAACDYFFEQKKAQNSSQNDDETKNLEAKKAIIEKIKTLDIAPDSENAAPTLHALIDEWHGIGFVPFKAKEKINRQFKEAVDAQFDKLNISKTDRQLENFKSNISGMANKSQVMRERERLMAQFDRTKSELKTYENNIGFLSVSSKKGNSLLDDMNEKVKKLKEDIELIVKKIEAIDKGM